MPNDQTRPLPLDISELPSNARSKNVPDERIQRLEKVVCDPVTQKKKGLWRKVKDSIIEDDSQSVLDYILQDVLIPALKEMIFDTGKGALEMTLFGGKRPGGGRLSRERDRTYTSYNTISMRNRDPRDNRPQLSRQSHAIHDFEEIVFTTRVDAEKVLMEIAELVDSQFRQATVADLLDACGLDHSYTDEKWGWTDLHDAYVDRVRGGWIIHLPRTKVLD